MRLLDDKIEKFASDIMMHVDLRRKQIIEHTEKHVKEEFGKKELEYLREAYEIIQNGMKTIDREKNEIISKGILESKKLLLGKREIIIKQTFEDATKQLIDFTHKDRYYDYLVKMIKDGLDKVGKDNCIVYIADSDKEHINKLNKEFEGITIKVEAKKIPMIGGCKFHNRAKNIYLDDSFYTRLHEQKDIFLYNCNLEIK